MTQSLTPQVLWAQRKDKLFVTIDVQDCKDPKIKLDNAEVDGERCGTLHFDATTGGDQQKYSVDLTFLHAIDPDASKINASPRGVILVIAKAESGDHWPRLQHHKGKDPHVTVDWSKYIDQDDEEEGGDTFDMNKLGDFSNFNMGNMGDMDMAGAGEDDSDDEELPDLEAEKPAEEAPAV